MDFLRAWFLGVAGAAMAGVFALAVTPPGAVKKVTQIAAALLLITAVLRPFAGSDSLPVWEDFPTLNADPAIGRTAPGSAPGGGSSSEILSSIIAEKTAAYIVNKAQAVGLVVSVTARCRDGGLYPEPWAVTVCSERPEHAKSALGGMIGQDLGIPPERQTYIERGNGP